MESDMSVIRDMPLWEKVPEAKEYFKERGPRPWRVALRPFAWRHGPGAFPMVGLPAIVRSETEGMHSFIYVPPVKSVVDKGVALADVSAFLSTAVGGDVAQADGRLDHLPIGHLLYIPGGNIVIPVACPTKFFEADAADEVDGKEKEKEKDKEDKSKDKSKDKDKDKGDISTAHIVVLSIFTPTIVQSVGTRPWTAIEAYNSDYLAKKADSPAWATRGKVFDQLLAGIKGTS